MRNYIIEMLGGVPREVYHDAEAERANYTKNYYLMSDKAAKLEQSLNEKISEIGQLQELLRISKAAVERVENERANCSAGWTTANERVAALTEELRLAQQTAADCAAKNEELALLPVRKYRLAATVATEGKRHDLLLHFADDNGGDVFVPVRSLAASRKNENDLASIANTINDTIERIIEA